MARRGINKETVFAAADRLAARGEAVTVTRLREEVGNTGSYTTISAYLKAWRTQADEEGTPERLPDGVEGGVLQLARRLWRSVVWLVDRRDAQRNHETEAHFGRLEHEVSDTEKALEDLAEHQREQERELEALRRREAEQAETVTRLEAEVARLRQQIAGMGGGD